MANPPAGWHPDPLSRHAQRYWDGQQWTEHVADESGNMATDPLDGGAGGQAQQAQGQQEAWGGQPTTQQDTSGWGQQPGDTTPSWGQGDTATSGEGTWGDQPGSTSGTGDWASSTDTAGAPAQSTWGEPDSGAAAAAAGAGAAGAAAATTASAEPDEATTATSAPADAGVPASEPGTSLPTVAQDGLVTIEVTDGVVVRHGSVVARSSSVTATDSAHPGALELAGSGSVHVAASGHVVAVFEVPVAGLTVRNDALLAHSGDLGREAAADGIVGYDATDVSGDGWVAVSAPGGVLEVSPVGGIDVTTAALVAWSSDLDVSHADDVNLNGHGIVLVSAETA